MSPFNEALRRRLTNMVVDEVSLVDRPANQHAAILIAKRGGHGAAFADMDRRLAALEACAGLAKAASFKRCSECPPRAACADKGRCALSDKPGTDTQRSGKSLVEAARRRGEQMRPMAKRASDPLQGARGVLARARTGMAKFGAGGGAVPVRTEIEVAEVKGDQRYVAGWASVIEIGGEVVADTQHDTIGEAELVRAAHEFVREFRVGKAMHAGAADAVEYVESVVMTREVQKAMGVDLGRVGWWVAGYVRDDAVWRRVKSGELRSLSIGGSAVRMEG